jgi:hypothetical protein
MNLDRFLGAVAEEVGSSVADEVRGYFRIGMLIVVLVVSYSACCSRLGS